MNNLLPSRRSSFNPISNNHIHFRHGTTHSTSININNNVCNEKSTLLSKKSIPLSKKNNEKHTPISLYCNTQDLSLLFSYTLTTLAATLPITLLPTIASDVLLHSDESSNSNNFIARLTTSAVFGMAIGKFINGPLGDFIGAKFLYWSYSILVGLFLMAFSFLRSSNNYFGTQIILICTLIEFLQSAKWPCVTIILADFYKNDSEGYSRAINLASLFSRLGGIIALSLGSYLLKSGRSWRGVLQLGAFVSFFSGGIMYYNIPNVARNPGQHFFTSFKSVIFSGVFWLVALAHTGGCMIQSSQRILGTYLEDTSSGQLDSQSSGGLVVFLSFGSLFGLALLGNIFTKLKQDFMRKKMIMMLYALTIIMCYSLSVLAMSKVRIFIGSPQIITCFQVLIMFFMGAGIALQLQIPAIVASKMYPKEIGTYLGYTEGVSYMVSSVVWRVVGDAVQEGNPKLNGWAYGWAGVALILVVSGVVMVEFIQWYFSQNATLPKKHAGNARLSLDRFYFGEKNGVKELMNNAGSWISSPHNTPTKMYQKFQPVRVRVISPEPWMSEIPKSTNIKHQLNQLLELPQNQTCADCNAPLPRWASILVSEPSIGCFCCADCAGAHRSLGTHICSVKSVDHDEWELKNFTAMEMGGNHTINKIYEKLLDQPKPNLKDDGWVKIRFIQDKYQHKKFYCDAVLHQFQIKREDNCSHSIDLSFSDGEESCDQNSIELVRSPQARDNDSLSPSSCSFAPHTICTPLSSPETVTPPTARSNLPRTHSLEYSDSIAGQGYTFFPKYSSKSHH